jgi:hypothetical protein
MTEAMCKCTDCVDNREGMCVAPKIDLDYGKDGGCQCLSYRPIEAGLLEDIPVRKG